MQIEEGKSLKDYNTFKVECTAERFVDINTEEDLPKLSGLLANLNSSVLILGGGSNILFTKDYEGLVVHSRIEGIDVVTETETDITIKVGSGYEWDKFVSFCVERNWGGIENLSDIPGNVGAAPVQNIGAYGTEAKDTILRVHAFNLKTGDITTFENKDCRFGYRYSIFKQTPNNQLFITHVEFKLKKNPVLNTSYSRVNEELQNYPEQNLKNLRNAIIKIRQSKLPPVTELASAGSFFKNPILEDTQAELLIKNHPDIPRYKTDEGRTKVPAAWLIEQSGLKGIQKGNVGTYKYQPLVIINQNNASGLEIADFSKYIQEEVFKKYGIKLEPEVCFI